MVTIEPIFISTLITSAAFTDILCARSPTDMVSATRTSRITGSLGAVKVVAASWSDLCLDEVLRPRQAVPVPSPRTLRPRFLLPSSTQVDVLAFLAPFLRAVSPSVGLVICNVPSVFISAVAAAGAAASGTGATGAATGAIASAASAAAASAATCLLRVRRFLASTSFFCNSINSACLRASSSRFAICSALMRGAGSAALTSLTAAGGTSASGAVSRLTTTRFLRTST